MHKEENKDYRQHLTKFTFPYCCAKRKAPLQINCGGDLYYSIPAASLNFSKKFTREFLPVSVSVDILYPEYFPSMKR